MLFYEAVVTIDENSVVLTNYGATNGNTIKIINTQTDAQKKRYN